MEPHEKGFLIPRRRRAMAPNKRLLAAWRNGVSLSSSWWVFGDDRNKKLFRERQREGEGFHLAIQHVLEVDLIARLEDGQLPAYGIEEGSDLGPIRIAEYYFSRSAKVNFDDDTVTALGRKFYEVRVQRQRKLRERTLPSGPPPIIDLREIAAQSARERLLETPPSVARTSGPHEIADQGAREFPHNTPPSETGLPGKPRMGRKPLVPILSKIVRELIDGRKFEGKSKKEITELVREKARERLKNDFSGPNSPSKPTIYAALVVAGWPPTDEK